MLVSKRKCSVQHPELAIDCRRLDFFSASLNVLLNVCAGQLGGFDVTQRRLQDRFDLQARDVGLRTAAHIVVLEQEIEQIADSDICRGE